MSGSIPTEIGLLTELTELDLSENELTNSIPTQIGLLTKLQSLCVPPTPAPCNVSQPRLSAAKSSLPSS